jgi:hypothetical protein
MTVDVKKRITLEEAINHPWFKVSFRITLEEAINHPWFKVSLRITLEEAIDHPWFKVSLRIILEEAINHPWFKVSISFLLTDSFCSHFIPWPEMSSLVSSFHKYMRNEQVLCPHLTNLLKKDTNNYWVSTKIMVLSPIVHRLCAICCLLFLPSSEAMFN